MEILWTDIETVPRYDKIISAPVEYIDRWIEHWNARNAWKKDGRDALESYNSEAGLHAEFGRVCTIALGHKGKFSAKTEKDEVKLLSWFEEICSNRDKCWLGGHSLQDFDLPFLIRRMIIHGMILPIQLKILGTKPWDLMIVDTNVMWSCGNWRYKIKLDLLCSILGIPSPKVETKMDGSDVRELFRKGEYEAINRYCKADIYRTSLVYEKLSEMSKYQ